MLSPHLEEVFREEARRALGVERVTLEQLVRTIADFLAGATPEEAAAFGQLVRGMAGSGEPASPAASPESAAVSEAVAALDAFRKEKIAQDAPRDAIGQVAPAVPSPPAPPATAPRRATAAPFRVSYPAPVSGPRAVASPDPPEPDPSPDDIEDFTEPASATA